MTADWFTEKHSPHSGLTLEIARLLHQSDSPYQQILVFENPRFGKVLVLDGCVMLTEYDEFIYHEMIVHPALLLHPDPQQVAVIGGGDGGSVREVLKHAQVQSVQLVEIDRAVIEVAEQHLPTLSAGLAAPRVHIECADGFAHLAEHPHCYDLVIVDSIDPVGESAKLFTAPFYQHVKSALREQGIAVFQTESPFTDGHVRQRAVTALQTCFAHVYSYWVHIPTYPGGVWSFTLASDALPQPHALREMEPTLAKQLRYFSPAVFAGALALPPYMNLPAAPTPAVKQALR